MASSRTVVSGADVDALFRGELPPSIASKPSSGRQRVYVPRYDRCDGCNTVEVGLFTFMGGADWSTSIPVDDRLRTWIDELRRLTDSRSISLCSFCIDAKRGPHATTAADEAQSFATQSLF